MENTDLICNKFDFYCDFKNGEATIKIESDLPKDTNVGVFISRIYEDKCDPGIKHSTDHFGEFKQLSYWENLQTIRVDNDFYKGIIEKYIDKLKGLVEVDITNIRDEVEITAIVPINQKNVLFGTGNKNLTGSAVYSKSDTTGLNIITREKIFNYSYK